MESTCQTTYRLVSKKEYVDSIEDLVLKFPWLDLDMIRPAPGHIPVLAELFKLAEAILRPSDMKKLDYVSVTFSQIGMNIDFELTRLSQTRRTALNNLTEQARLLAACHCPACGRPVSGWGILTKMVNCCPDHFQNGGFLFVDDLVTELPEVKTASLDSKPTPTERSAGPGGKTEATPSMPEPENPSQKEKPSASLPVIAFLDPAGLAKYEERFRYKQEERKKVEHFVERIRAAGNASRTLGVLPDDPMALLDEFEICFPNFAELAEFLRDHFALSTQGDRRVAWPPILLVGPAGIGKTETARWLAERLSLGFRVFDMASAQNGSPLSGSDSFWANSAPGLLFELLAFQANANPVVVLDELDKIDRSAKFDPMAPLYSLLEPRSARNFTDLSIGDFSINASHVNWILTANDTASIPAPILSRLTVLNIPAPTPRQVEQIAQSIYQKLRSESAWGAAFTGQLDPSVASALGGSSPRSLGLALRRAFGAAARAGRNFLCIEDFPALSVESPPGSIGFLAHLTNKAA